MIKNKRYIEEFYSDYKNSRKWYDENSKYYATVYKIPVSLHDEFSLLYYYYRYYYKSTYTKKITNHIKNTIKNDALESILAKIKNTPLLYNQLEELFIKNKKFNSPSSLDYISNSSVLYIFYLLKSAMEKTPDYIKDSKKYNL